MANQNDLINKQQHCISNYRQTNNNIVYQIIGKKDKPFNHIGHFGPFVHFGCFVQNLKNCDKKWQKVTKYDNI